MNFSKRVFITFKSETKIQVFDPMKPLSHLIKCSIQKFGLLDEPQNYCLALIINKDQYIQVKSVDELQNNDNLILTNVPERLEFKEKEEIEERTSERNFSNDVYIVGD